MTVPKNSQNSTKLNVEEFIPISTAQEKLIVLEVETMPLVTVVRCPPKTGQWNKK